MTTSTIDNQEDHPGTAPTATAGPFFYAVLTIWFVATLAGGAAGLFEIKDGAPGPALLAAIIGPPILFFLAHQLFAGLRAWVASLDLGLVTALQGWRVAGALFLPLWYFGLLPGVFAAPAGFGDVAVGLAAPFVALAVWRKSEGWRRASYGLIAAGVLDFIVAVGTGVSASAGGPLFREGGVPSDIINLLPLGLIPTFVVPAFAIMHLIAWLKLQREA